MFILKNEDNIEVKIYSTQELQELEPTLADLNYFKNSPDLYLSYAVNMFKFCGISDSDEEILNICHTNPDYYKDYRWTKEQKSEYMHIWTQIFKKCLNLQTFEAYHALASYGAMGIEFYLTDDSPEYTEEYLKLVKDLETVDDAIHVIGVSHDNNEQQSLTNS